MSKNILTVADFYTVKVPSRTEKNWKLWENQMSKTSKKNFHILRTTIAKQLRDLGIVFEIVPLPLDKTNGIYWVDLPYDYIDELYPDKKELPHIIPILKLSADGKQVANFDIFMQHNGIIRNLKKKVMEIMAIFGKRFIWNGKSSKSMLLNIH